MFGFAKKGFVVAMTFFSFNPVNVKPLECVSMNNQRVSNKNKNNKYQQ